jgi:hypothetical protein
MRSLRIALLLLIPVYLHAGFLNIQLSATCDTTTITASSGSAICYGPGQGMSRAEAGLFADGGAMGFATAMGQLNDFSTFFSATMAIQAAYQITFFGIQGPGYMHAEVCGFEDDLGAASATLITPNGSIFADNFPRITMCRINDIPITFGVPLDVRLSFNADVAHVSCCGAAGEDGAAVDFTYLVLDANKNLVPFTVEVVIPEPSTWQFWIVGACLLVLQGCALRKQVPKFRSNAGL